MTLTPGTSTSAALRGLKDLRVELPDPPHTAGSASSGAGSAGVASFRLQAARHSPNVLPPLPEFMSAVSRIAFDRGRCLALAALLDEVSGVAGECNLAALLDSLGDLSPSDALDVSVAYLRRVHMFVYYSGRGFGDEAQLLSRGSAVVCRTLLPPPPPGFSALSAEEEAAREGGDESGDGSAAIAEGGEQDSPPAQTLPEEYTGKTTGSISAMDKRVAACLLELQGRVERKRSCVIKIAEGGEGSSAAEESEDERDARVIAEARNKVSQ